jgi:hypothetical protein
VSRIVITYSGRLWCQVCDAVARPAEEGWTSDLIVDWIEEHQCEEPTEEDLLALARQAVLDRSRDRFLAKYGVYVP